MILFLTRKLSGSADILMKIFSQRHISVFRLNLDMFDQYQFQWGNDGFSISNSLNLSIDSCKIKVIICYKGLISIDEYTDFEETHIETKYIKSWLNCLYHDIVKFGYQNKHIRFWTPWEHIFPKVYQMNIAQRYFNVPDYLLHWGKELPSKNVVCKTLTSRPLENRNYVYVKKVNQNQLDISYPWFTQNVATGNRDATVLYINGKVHCFQFATERGNLTDWRVTQGTEANQWSPWDAGKEFEEKIDLYMKDMGLKYGRLDFIIGGREPQFLEVNPTGQFGWLDDENLTLHNEVVDAILDPSSTITL